MESGGRVRSAVRAGLHGIARGYTDARGWWVTAMLTLLAAAIRLPSLGWPKAFSFDETYYAKDAFSLLKFGYERAFVGPANELILAGNLAVFRDTPEFVVHPSLGKWAIALGEHFFGVNPFGWRIVMAVLGIWAVAIVHRTALRLTANVHAAALAALFMAIDGLAIVLSRTALLDQTLMFFVLATFWALVRDRDAYEHTLAVQQYLGRVPAWRRLRPWRILAILTITAAFSTKWSALWFAIGFAFLALWWDGRARRAHDVEHTPWLADLGWLAASAVIGVGGYLLSWIGWFRSSDAWDRTWTDGTASWLPQSLRSLIYYHRQALHFHVTLTSDHPYKASPYWWPLQLRPTSFFYENYQAGQGPCALDVQCSSEVLALGNVIIWWTACLTIVVLLLNLLGRLLRMRIRRGRLSFDGRAAGRVQWDATVPALIGVAAGWLPWVYFHNRTTFTFYSIVFTPFICMLAAQGLTLFATRRVREYLPVGEATPDAAAAQVLAALHDDEWESMHGAFRIEGSEGPDPLFIEYDELAPKRFMLAAVVVVLAVIASIYLMPIWTGSPIAYTSWHYRMLFDSWI